MSDAKHTMNLLLAKDSLEEEIADGLVNLAPESKKKPIVHDDLEDFYSGA